MCSRESEFKSILFSLVYFHAVVIERRKFGPQGWNRSYPYNTGDLTISVYVLYNYLEANAKVAWLGNSSTTITFKRHNTLSLARAVNYIAAMLNIAQKLSLSDTIPQ